MSKQIKLIVFGTLLIESLFASTTAMAQKDTIRYDVSWAGAISSGKYAPFWQQSNRYGTLLSSPNSTTLMAGISKNADEMHSLFKYGFKATLLLQTGSKETNVYFHELYIQGKLSVFDLIVGAREEHLGCQDSTLSGGGMLFSHNSRPMPKITAGIEHFTPVPFTHGYLEVKGAMSHGWFTDNVYMQNVYLHHLYAYLRIGGRLPVHLSYGADHVAQWGGHNSIEGQQPDGWNDFIRIVEGKDGGSNALQTDRMNALGNHIISQNIKLEGSWRGFSLSAYWQNLQETGPIRFIGFTPNASDGLWGVVLRNKRFPIVKGILYEYFRTIDQSGPMHDRDGLVYGGNNGYYMNGVYQEGWNYYYRSIASPFISSPLYNSDGTIYTLNNRVAVHHFGAEGDIGGYNYKLLASFSKNCGSYSAPLSSVIKNSSFLLEVHKLFPRLQGLEATVSLAADFGKLYGNSTGCMITLRKRGLLFKY
ncbi:MAG: hypothetical protein H6Q17_1299 [Bacteroidetes bacterium]|nr:hypothetical protein [Bacteroidota bacterium]